MLEPRSAYGYFGSAGGFSGETPPAWWDCIEKNMLYCEYKRRYPECKTLGDYDKVRKTITVLIPEEYADRPNFGNHYSMHEFAFSYTPKFTGFSDIFECRAKNYANALKAAKRWAKRSGRTITGDAPGHEYQKNFG